MLRLLHVLAVLALVLAIVAPARAQRTGGSFGGGDWGGSSSSSSGGGYRERSYEPPRTYDPPEPRDPSPIYERPHFERDAPLRSVEHGDTNPPPPRFRRVNPEVEPNRVANRIAGGVVLLAVLGFGAFVLIGPAVRRRWGPHLRLRLPFRRTAPRWSIAADVTAIRVGLDGRARGAIQTQLNQLARSASGAEGREGLARWLRAVARALLQRRESWLYVWARDQPPAPADAARAAFEQLAVDARARFRDALVRGVDGVVEPPETAPLAPRAEEGEGVVVVTIVAAIEGDLPGLGERPDAGEVARFLGTLRSVDPARVVAVEVIWSPAADADRMSTAELEALYPELRKVAPDTVGRRVACASCGAAMADELEACPRCGAPHRA